MVLFPQSVTYAVESLGYLASFEPKTFIKVKNIAKDLKIPEYYLGKILTAMVKKKILISAKGPSGGVALSIDPGKLTLYKILSALDAFEADKGRCLLGSSLCSGRTPCPFHKEWERFQKEFKSVAQKTTLAVLSKNESRGKTR
ncbi:MAG: Rrf2 family transcriptional regulator [candidate division Zixibacteria bacterium]|nr:Rrf2 family transcriptional regulator [candidate division Zixibacteria bacterium]